MELNDFFEMQCPYMTLLPSSKSLGESSFWKSSEARLRSLGKCKAFASCTDLSWIAFLRKILLFLRGQLPEMVTFNPAGPNSHFFSVAIFI